MMSVRIGASLCALAIVGTLAACGSSDDKESNATTAGGKATKPLNIGLFTTENSPLSAKQVETARKWAADNGAKVTVVDPAFNPQKQYSQLQDAIAQRRFDAVGLWPMNGPALAPLVKQADAAGIAAVAIGAPLSADTTTMDINVPGLDGMTFQTSTKRAGWMAEQAAAACAGIDPCEVAYLPFIRSIGYEQDNIKAFKEAIKRHPSIEFLPVLADGLGQRAPAVGIAQDLVLAHPNVDVLIAATDLSLLGAEVGLKKAGKKWGMGPGELRLAGIGGTKQGIQRVKDGEWASTQIFVPENDMLSGLEILTSAIDGTLSAPKGVDNVSDGKYPPIMTKEAIEQSGFKGQY